MLFYSDSELTAEPLLPKFRSRFESLYTKVRELSAKIVIYILYAFNLQKKVFLIANFMLKTS